MANDIIQLFTNNVGSVVTAAAFIYYLIRRDKEFSQVISNHLAHSQLIQKETNEASKGLTRELQKLGDVIDHMDRRLNGKKKHDT